MAVLVFGEKLVNLYCKVTFKLKRRSGMNFLELVKRRYSCRAYEQRPVEREKLDYVMECARMAPSAVNKQPWRFRVISDGDGRAKLQQCYARDWRRQSKVWARAGCAISMR